MKGTRDEALTTSAGRPHARLKERLFFSWLALSTVNKLLPNGLNCVIQWIEVYPVDNAIHLLK